MRISILPLALVLCTSAAMADRSTLDETKTQLAYRMSTPPEIDGVLNQIEWEQAGYHPESGPKGWFWQVRYEDRMDDAGLFVVEDFIRGGANGDGAVNPPLYPGDLDFAIFAGYDDEYLYIGVRVKDDVMISDSAEPDSANGSTWLDDSVEIFIDGDNSNFDGRDTSGTNPEVVDTGGQFVITVNNAYRDAEAGSPGYGESGAWFAKTAARDETGYDAEFRISLDTIGNPDFGDVIGFTVGVNDDDDEGAGDRQVVWVGSPHNEITYGNLIIGGKSYTAAKVSAAPTVDGSISSAEYAGAEEIIVNPHTGVYDLREGDDNFTADDNGFSAWAVHDDESIYVAIHARDNLIFNDSTEPNSVDGNTWDDDSVEIYFDADDSDDIGRGTFAFEGQYVFTANRAIRTAEANNPTFGANADWFAANQTAADGYTTEFKIKKSALGDPADGATLGFHMDMNDDDGNLSGGRKAQIGWSGRSHAEFTYGVLTLGSGSTGGALEIEKIEIVGDNVEITIRSDAALARHALQRAGDLPAGTWGDFQATFSAGAAGTVIARFPKPADARGFYRAALNP